MPGPTRQELLDAASRTVPDIIAPGLKILFVGINPGLYTAFIGHHFGRPGNRFWPALHRSGFTDRQLDPREDGTLLDLGYGLTNVVPRASAAADELTKAELKDGGRALVEKIRKYRPEWVAFVGIGAYRDAYGKPRAKTGRQPEEIGGAKVWVLPNPSGLNAHYSVDRIAMEFRALRHAAEGSDGPESA
jgi:TDG/mug DNA glycosylase family protein